jgi:MFS family permease
VGVLVIPFEEEFGWSRSTTSIAVALNLVLYGLAAPFATALMERLGIRNVAVGALGLIAIGTGLTTIMTEPWHLVLLWGVVVGLGVGATALVFGSLVVTRWFVRHQGLMLGVMGAAWATGQLIFLPIIAHYVSAEGWRVASVGIAGVALCMIPIGMACNKRPTQRRGATSLWRRSYQSSIDGKKCRWRHFKNAGQLSNNTIPSST